MKDSRIKINVTDIVLLVFSLAYLILLLTAFKACGPKDDGSFMKCQWAWRAVVSTTAVIVINAVIHLLFSEGGIKTGLSISILTISISNILLVGTVIPLCGMEDMACRSLTKPGNTALGIITAISAIADIVVISLKKKK